MRLEYSLEAEALYIYLGRKRRVEYTKDIGGVGQERLIDYTKDGTPVGIEILGTKNGIEVSGLPQAEEVAELLRTHGFAVRR